MEYYQQFQRIHFLERVCIADRLRLKHPTKLRIIIDRFKSTDPSITKHKYLAEPSMNGYDLFYLIRSRIKLNAYQNIFLFYKNTILYMNHSLSIYEPDEDGFIYLFYSLENTFGGVPSRR